jgi:hypothetical protein
MLHRMIENAAWLEADSAGGFACGAVLRAGYLTIPGPVTRELTRVEAMRGTADGP